MEIIRCPKPKCIHSDGGTLVFHPSRPGSRPYPRVKHYDSSKKSKKTECYLTKDELKQVEFTDEIHNIWKSVLDPKDWYKIPSLASGYSNIDLYLNRTENEKFRERIVETLEQEIILLKKFRKKEPEIIEFWKRDKKTFDYIMFRIRILTKMESSIKFDGSQPESFALGLAILLIMSKLRLELLMPMKLAKLENSFISSKRLNQILKLQVKEVLPLFDPKTRNEALMSNFCGVQCPKCKSWRTDLAPDDIGFKCRCYACDARFERGMKSKCGQCHLPFFDEIIKKMIQNPVDTTDDTVLTRCIRCKNEVSLSAKHLVLIQTCETN